VQHSVGGEEFSTFLRFLFDVSQAHAAVPSIPACPVPPTTLKQLQFNQFIPNSFPAGPYSGMVNATDQTGRVIQCVQFNFNLS
jgi:hypothetical protein